jgi:hypothetical protein
MSSLSNEVKGQLSRYVSGEVAPDVFHKWSALALLQANAAGDSEAESLLHSVEWEFLDLENGQSSLEFLKEHLTRLSKMENVLSDNVPSATTFVNNYIVSEGATITRPSPLNVTWLAVGRWLFAAPADTEFSAVFASTELHR